MSEQLIGPILIGAATIISLFASVQKLKKGFKEELHEETERAVTSAKQAAESDVQMLALQLENLSQELRRLDSSFQKDVAHIRETYNNEIKNLGTKIEELREEVRGQHSQLVTLLTKLVSDR